MASTARCQSDALHQDANRQRDRQATDGNCVLDSEAATMKKPTLAGTAFAMAVVQAGAIFIVTSYVRPSVADAIQAQQVVLRYDGLYRAGPSGSGIWSFMRFYEGGTVLDMAVAGRDPEPVLSWLTMSNAEAAPTYSGKGPVYWLPRSGRSLITIGHFSSSHITKTRQEADTVVTWWEADIEGDGDSLITLHWTNHNTNLTGTLVWQFVPMDTLRAVGDSASSIPAAFDAFSARPCAGRCCFRAGKLNKPASISPLP
jgi:hypothetical protein